MYISDDVPSTSPKKYVSIQTRESDIKKRGKKYLVHDYDGNVVELYKARVWFSYDGNYIEPRSYKETICDVCIVS